VAGLSPRSCTTSSLWSGLTGLCLTHARCTRLPSCLQNASPEEASALRCGYNRIVGTADSTDEKGTTFPGMGERYKAVAITSTQVLSLIFCAPCVGFGQP